MSRMIMVLFRRTILLTILLLWQTTASAALLYDASLGNTPNAQSWSYVPDNGTLFMPPSSSVSMFYSATGTVLQTISPTNDDRAGFFRYVPPLDRMTGYTLNFNVRLDGESHETPHRSGFSVIALSSDKKGIELSFWRDENQIFAKNDDVPFFTRGESVTANTSTLNEYFLTIQGNGYSLTGASLPMPLTGSLRDYSANPFYNTPNYIFLGDNTTSAGADIFLGNVSLQAIPEPGTYAVGFMIVAGAIAFARRSRMLAA